MKYTGWLSGDGGVGTLGAVFDTNDKPDGKLFKLKVRQDLSSISYSQELSSISYSQDLSSISYGLRRLCARVHVRMLAVRVRAHVVPK